jgi:hypothetical protein
VEMPEESNELKRNIKPCKVILIFQTLPRWINLFTKKWRKSLINWKFEKFIVFGLEITIFRENLKMDNDSLNVKKWNLRPFLSFFWEILINKWWAQVSCHQPSLKIQ